MKGKETGRNKVKNENTGKLKWKVPVYIRITSNFISDSIKSIIKSQLKKNKFITIEKEDFSTYTRQIQMEIFNKIVASKNAKEDKTSEEITKEVYSHTDPVMQFLYVSCMLTNNNGNYTIDSLSYTINYYPTPEKKPTTIPAADNFINRNNIQETFVNLTDSLSKN